ncbi:UNVERIFIED_CONTAM: N-acetylglucosamine 6-phosphate deacetylase [Acetivibrio alkalicellulosi]
MKLIKNGLIFDSEKGLTKKDILIYDKKIAKIEENIYHESSQVINADHCMVVPGFIDIHTHGGMGYDVMTPQEEVLNSLSIFFASKGVTSFLPVIMTAPIVEIIDALKNINNSIKKGTKGAKIIGVNLEGPFINSEFSGAHPLEHIIEPTIELIDNFIIESGNNIKMLTIAPELAGVKEIVQHFEHTGIIFCAGHSALDYTGAQDAFNSGFSHVTHLFNAMNCMHHRDPGLAGAALEKENISVEIIGDGIHVSPAFIKMTVKSKSISKVALITDSMVGAGLKSGKYTFGGNEIYIDNGISKLKSGVLAGSTITMIDIVKNMVNKFEFSIEDTIKMVCETPAKIVGVYDKKGSLSTGKDGDIVIMDDKMNVLTTIVEGNIVYQR